MTSPYILSSCFLALVFFFFRRVASVSFLIASRVFHTPQEVPAVFGRFSLLGSLPVFSFPGLGLQVFPDQETHRLSVGGSSKDLGQKFEGFLESGV